VSKQREDRPCLQLRMGCYWAVRLASLRVSGVDNLYDRPVCMSGGFKSDKPGSVAASKKLLNFLCTAKQNSCTCGFRR